MRSNLLLFLVISCFFVSCNKEKRYNRYLQGSWKCTLVRLQDYDGFTFFDHQPSGTLVFNGIKVNGLILSQFASFQGVTLDTLNLQGTFTMDLTNNELNWVQNSGILKNRIFVITRDNLEFEYFDVVSSQRLRYVFEKQ